MFAGRVVANDAVKDRMLISRWRMMCDCREQERLAGFNLVGAVTPG